MEVSLSGLRARRGLDQRHSRGKLGPRQAAAHRPRIPTIRLEGVHATGLADPRGREESEEPEVRANVKHDRPWPDRRAEEPHHQRIRSAGGQRFQIVPMGERAVQRHTGHCCREPVTENAGEGVARSLRHSSETPQ
jgi:hypothetical protein